MNHPKQGIVKYLFIPLIVTIINYVQQKKKVVTKYFKVVLVTYENQYDIANLNASKLLFWF